MGKKATHLRRMMKLSGNYKEKKKLEALTVFYEIKWKTDLIQNGRSMLLNVNPEEMKCDDTSFF